MKGTQTLIDIRLPLKSLVMSQVLTNLYRVSKEVQDRWVLEPSPKSKIVLFERTNRFLDTSVFSSSAEIYKEKPKIKRL